MIINLNLFRWGLEEELEKEFKVLVDKGYKFFIVDLKTDEILNLMELEEFDEVLIFNTRSNQMYSEINFVMKIFFMLHLIMQF